MADSMIEMMRILGRVEEGQERLRIELDALRAGSDAKLDKIGEDVAIVGQIAAQARDKAEALDKIITHDVKPATDEFKEMRSFGKRAIMAISLAAAALGVTVTTFFSAVSDAIKAWLRT